eukprot:g1260.t1
MVRCMSVQSTMRIVGFSLGGRNLQFNASEDDTLSQLKGLQSLDLRDNTLVGPLPRWLKKLQQLQSLDLSHNELTGSIEALSELTSLSFLDLSHNQLNKKKGLNGPIDAISKLTTLLHLGLSSTHVNGQLDALKQLTRLSYLDLSSTRVSGKIDVLKQLTNLSHLDLSLNNRLFGKIDAVSQLPRLAVPKLGTLILKNNNFTGLVPRLAAAGGHTNWSKISNYVGIETGAFVCVCVFAYALAIKMVLKKKLQRERDAEAGLINLSEDVSTNDIMQKMPMDIVVKVAKEGRTEEITFHTWDFGGQQVYYVLHHLFITEGIYCLCFDMREAKGNSDEWLQYLAFWLNSVYAHVIDKDRCSVILVGTHKDVISSQDDHSSISDAIRTTFEQCSFWQRICIPPLLSSAGLCFFPVDNTRAVDATGIADVLGTINMLAEEQVRVREERPLSWLKVLDELQTLAETTNYIYLSSNSSASAPDIQSRIRRNDEPKGPYEHQQDLWTIAQRHNVLATDFDELVQFFDAVGIFKVCRSRRDTASSRDVVVLQPQWLVNVFSAAISCCHDKYLYVQPSEDEHQDLDEATTIHRVLALDLYRFESKAILSVRLLRHLWQHKRVITHDREGTDELFELLVELMLRFDLIFELRHSETTSPTDGQVEDEDNRCYLVPAMLEELAFSPVLPRGGEQELLRCHFLFQEREEQEQEQEDQDGCDISLASVSVSEQPHRGKNNSGSGSSRSRSSGRGTSGGMLPAVVFTKLQAKCAHWAQTTSNAEPVLSKNFAEVCFGAQRFSLRLAQEQCAIMLELRAYTRPQTIVSRLKTMVDDILSESFPSLGYSIHVRDVHTGHYLPLARVELEVMARRAVTRSNEYCVRYRGRSYDCAQFEAWIPREEDDYGFHADQPHNHSDPPPAHHQNDLFICAHETDLEFAQMLSDCLSRQTGGKIRVKCSGRVTPWSLARAREQPALLGKYGTVRQDLFSISRSAVFVPIISMPTLEQWRFEKRPARPGPWSRRLCLTMAALTVVQVLTGLWNALLHLSNQRVTCIIVMASLLVPFVLHSITIWRLVQREYHTPNLAFRQWLLQHHSYFPILFFLGSIRPDILCYLLDSQAFGWSLFLCPLSLHTSRQLKVAGFISNLLHDLPQLCVSSYWLVQSRYERMFSVKWYSFVLMAACSAVSLLYSVATRLSTLLLANLASSSSYSGSGSQDSGVDEMLLEYMTALRLYSLSEPSHSDHHSAQRHQSRSHSRLDLRSLSQASQPPCSGACKLIVPVVINDIFDKSMPKKDGTDKSIAMLLHPIGDVRIPTRTLRTYRQILQRDLDLDGIDASYPADGTVSGVLHTVLCHCSRTASADGLVFSGQDDKWARYDAAAEFVLRRLCESDGCSPQVLQHRRSAPEEVKSDPVDLTSGMDVTEDKETKRGFNSGSAVAGPGSQSEPMDSSSSASASTRRLLWRQRELWAGDLDARIEAKCHSIDARSAGSHAGTERTTGTSFKTASAIDSVSLQSYATAVETKSITESAADADASPGLLQ